MTYSDTHKTDVRKVYSAKKNAAQKTVRREKVMLFSVTVHFPEFVKLCLPAERIFS